MSLLNTAVNLLMAPPPGAAGYSISRSLRFNSSDSAYLSRTPASAGNRKTWTWAGWVKRSGLGTYQRLFDARNPGVAADYIRFNNNDTLEIYIGATLITSQVFRDPGSWYHLVVAVDTTQATASNRVKLYVNEAQVTTFGTANYPSQNADSVFNAALIHSIGTGNGTTEYFSGYLAEIHFIDGQALTPSSFTEVSATTGQLIPKAYTGSFGTNGFWLPFSDNSAATATTLGKDYSGNGNNWTPNNFSVTGTVNHVTSGLSYRKGARFSSWDTSSADTTPSSSVAADNYWWVDLGSSKTINKIEFDATITGTGSADFYFLYSTSSSSSGSSGCPAGCTITATRSIAGAAPNHHVVFTGFGSITGRYIGISNGTAGSSPTTFSNLRVLDDQGKDNDSLVDTPTSYGTDAQNGGEVRGNYCTLNPLDQGSSISLTNGNLDVSCSSSWKCVRGTIGVSSGKWYWEYTMTAAGYTELGIGTSAVSLTTYPGSSANAYIYYSPNGNKGNNNSFTSYGNSYTTGDVIGVAVDLDNGKIWFAKNGTWQNSGNPASGTNAAFTSLPAATYFPIFGLDNTGGTVSGVFNAGARAFAYTAPSGFKALCDTNLTAPVVAKPNTVMDVITYTGTGSSLALPNGSSTPTSISFTPDFAWIKGRSGATDHALYDAVRGVQKDLVSNSTSAETTETTGLTAFGTNTFTVGSLAKLNTSSSTYVAWAWNAGGSTVTNTQGSITSSVRANTSAGFSIVTWTGTGSGSRTIGHGGLVNLDKGMIIVKDRSLSRQWNVYHGALGATKGMVLNSTFDGGNYNDSGYWNNTAPTSTVFTVGVYVNEASNYVAYCFAPVAGYSSFGLYDAGTDPFVYLGFRPAMLMIKRSNGTENWNIVDNRRNAVGDANVVTYSLQPNSSGAEYQAEPGIDLLSNGFKLRGSFNSAGGQYIYAAWAASPFQYARAR